ncbi:Wadjet anti-phage system protein JetD domain-containing protein [Hippea sp. KM1]|uniref:Wadjet anti-phage system protein JetD domain-containing protein n=1 Tax=Hippea sp. KM1 TaxID=944481 RepID=UPI00046D5614|nr:Wadjet anti-phage system protein JetD domain-containing protein [Hippea sp. KM1]
MDRVLEEARQKIIDFMENEYRGEDIRFCSAYLFGDSKFIEKNRVLADTFNGLAVVERPNIIYIKTDTELKINGVSIRELTEKLHLAAFFGGDIKSIENSANNVIISENLSFFMSAKPKNSVFLYNKGFHLTKQISHFVKKLTFDRVIFFGDVDLEGLAIYDAFREHFDGIEFYPDPETIRFVISVYGDALPPLKQQDRKITFLKGIAEMLKEKNVRIEQEFLQVLFARGRLKRPEWMDM